jgi:ubiquinone/menaquinone biosynthesis C-methylase UbiE
VDRAPAGGGMKVAAERTSQVDLVTEVFDRKAPTYADGYEGGSSAAHSFVIRRSRVYELLAGRQGGTLLDIGCGPGITVTDLTARKFEIYGVDISAPMIEECVRRFGHLPTAHFSIGAIERLEFPDGFFDAVIALGVVEYVDDDDVAIAEMKRVLKPGGTMIVTLPNRRSPFRFWQRTVYAGVRRLLRSMTGKRGPAEIDHREYSEAGYLTRLRAQGLMVSDVVYYNFKVVLFPFDRWFPSLTVALSRALERFGRGPLRWMGTGLIVKAEKP